MKEFYDEIKQCAASDGALRLYLDRINTKQKFRKTGKGYNCLCPLHNNTRTPAFSIFRGQNGSWLWKCFSGCGEGDIFDFLIKYEARDFKQAAQIVADHFVIPKPDSGKPSAAPTVGRPKKQPSTRKLRKSDVPKSKARQENCPSVLSDIYDALQLFALEQPICRVKKAAYRYLTQGRGFERETIEGARLFVIGNPAKAVRFLRANFSDKHLKASGLFSQKGFFMFTYHPLIIPFIAENGRIVNLQGRKLDAVQSPENMGKYVFLSGRPKMIYGAEKLQYLMPGRKVYLFEGAFDALAGEQLGFVPGLALGGVNLSGTDLLNFSNLKPVFGFDNDKAGRDAAEKYTALFHRAQIPTYSLNIPKNHKDINGFLIAEKRRAAETPKAYKAELRQTEQLRKLKASAPFQCRAWAQFAELSEGEKISRAEAHFTELNPAFGKLLKFMETESTNFKYKYL